MVTRIIIALVTGCALASASLLYCHTNTDSSFRGAPLAFLQQGMTLSFESRYTVDFKALIVDVLVFSVPVWLILQLLRTKRPTERAVGAA